MVCISSIISGQNLDQLGKLPWLKVSGGVATNGVYYDGTANREAFTYFVNGNLNFNIGGVYNLPLTFSYTNQDFGYTTPFKINRLSIHPSYKWITTHIGDVSMVFSPYTVNGHQFTGFGFDLSPKGAFKISALYGRFLRATEFDENTPEQLPTYKRMGYGVKAFYDFKKVGVGVTVFKAKDDETSLQIPIPENLNIFPKENLVINLESELELIKKGKFRFEIAQSAVTENVLDEKSDEGNDILGILIDKRLSTSYYTAFNTDFTYTYGKGDVAISYERIDPKYSTFGAYFFNNDLENITLKTTQRIFNDRVSLSFNGGLQRNDLANQKESQSNRIVTALQATAKASDRMRISASYSNFQSYTNIKNRFDAVNELDEVANRDTLDFRQVSQNAALQIGYALTNTKKQRQQIGFTFNFQNSKDIQGNQANDNASNFYNGVMSHALEFPKKSLKFTTSFTGVYNVLSDNKSLQYGPTLAINKLYFDKKLRTGLSSSYAIFSTNGTAIGDVYNVRGRAGYTYKEQHQFDLNALLLFRNNKTTQNKNDFTLTFGYRYSFDVKKPNIDFGRRNPKEKDSIEKPAKIKYYRFRYRDIVYEGNSQAVTGQIQHTSEQNYFNDRSAFDTPRFKKSLDTLALHAFTNKDFKRNALGYLDDLYQHIDFIPIYDRLLLLAVQRIKKQVDAKNYSLMSKLGEVEYKMEHHPIYQNTSYQPSADEKQEYQKILSEFAMLNDDIDTHFVLKNWIDAMASIKSIQKSKGDLKTIKKLTIQHIFELKQNNTPNHTIISYLLDQLILFYDQHHNPKKI